MPWVLIFLKLIVEWIFVNRNILHSYLSHNCTKLWTINTPWPKCNQIWNGQVSISMPNIRTFISCILQRIPGNHHLKPFKKMHKIREINRPLPNGNKFWQWPGYTNMQNFRPFQTCKPKKMSRNTFWTNGRRASWSLTWAMKWRIQHDSYKKGTEHMWDHVLK